MTISSRTTELNVPGWRRRFRQWSGPGQRDGEGQDEFVFQISKDEYLDLLFEDLALPNLKQNQQRQLTEYKTHRAGYTANGVPANISVVRSLQNSLARRTAMTAGKRRELHALEENLAIISNSEPAQLLEEERLRKEIAELRAKIERVPFIDTFDLRYKNYEKRPDPSSQGSDVLPDGRFRFNGSIH